MAPLLGAPGASHIPTPQNVLSWSKQASCFCHSGPSLEVTSQGGSLAACLKVVTLPDLTATGFLVLVITSFFVSILGCVGQLVCFLEHLQAAGVSTDPGWRGTRLSPDRLPPSAPQADDLRVFGLSFRSHLGRHARLLFGDELHPLTASTQLSSESQNLGEWLPGVRSPCKLSPGATDCSPSSENDSGVQDRVGPFPPAPPAKAGDTVICPPRPGQRLRSHHLSRDFSPTIRLHDHGVGHLVSENHLGDLSPNEN